MSKHLEVSKDIGNSDSVFNSLKRDQLFSTIKNAKEEKDKIRNIIFNLELFLVDATNYVKRKQIEREDLRLYDDEPKILSMPQYIHVEMKKSKLKEK